MSELKDTVYYEAHCSGCGEVTTADLLAFDFGRLINKAIVKAGERQFGREEKWEPLLRMDMSMYYTWRDLQSTYKLQVGKFSTFSFTVKNLKDHISNLINVRFEEIAAVEDINSSLIYQKLTKKIKTPLQEGKKVTHQDIDIQEHAENIFQVIQMCSKGRSQDDEVIAELEVEAIMEKDDQGNPFAKKLRVKYEDEMIEAVINNVCPNCGKPFYSEVGKHKEIIICMAGSARVGKTAYLAALVDRIEKNSGDFAVVVPSNDPEWEFFREHILEVYQRGGKIDKTQFEGSGETIPLFSLEIQICGRSYIFTFIDMPGEAFDNKEDDAGVKFINNDRRIVTHAQMIWFCIAPQQVDAQLAQLAGLTTAAQDKVNTDTVKVMGNIRKTMEAVCLDGKKNAAVLVTMSDTILEQDSKSRLFRPEIEIFQDYLKPRLGTDFALDFDATNEFMKASQEYLDKARNIGATMTGMFENYRTFAVAAYGKAISDDDLDQFIEEDYVEDSSSDFVATPSMVELPFLWTLSVLGIIPSFRIELQDRKSVV